VFNSNFNKDKLFIPELVNISEEAIEQEFGKKFRLSGKVDASMAMPPMGGVAPVKVVQQYSQPVSPAPEVKKVDTLDSALSMFGGKVME